MIYSYKTQPYQHQQDVLELSWDKINWAFFMEMGTGKSKVAIDTATILYLSLIHISEPTRPY